MKWPCSHPIGAADLLLSVSGCSNKVGPRALIPYGEHLGNIGDPYFIKKLRLLIDSFERAAVSRCEALGIVSSYLRVTHACRAFAVIDGSASWSHYEGTFVNIAHSTVHLVFSDRDVLPATEEIWAFFLGDNVTYNAAIGLAMSAPRRGQGWRPFRDAFGVSIDAAALDDWQAARRLIDPAAEAYVRFELHWVDNLSLRRTPTPLFGPSQRLAHDSKRTCLFLMSESVDASLWTRLCDGAVNHKGLDDCTRAEWGAQFDSLAHLWRSLIDATYIVADVTGGDPMVMYAIGLAHGLRRHVVIMGNAEARLPFDLRRTVAIAYENLEAEVEDMWPLLAEAFEALDKAKERPELLPLPLSRPSLLRDPRLVFVLMPFTRPWSDHVWTELFRPVFAERGFKCQRADEWTQPEIMEDVWQGICSAETVLVDLTGRNPNVLYELGLLHSFRKDFVLVVQNIADIPPPLSRYRAIVYDADGKLTERLRKDLLALAQGARER